MKLRLDLIIPLLLIATAGAGSVAVDAAAPACSPANVTESRGNAEARIAAEGYSEVRMLGVGCDDAWHALALAEGDPVRLKVTAEGAVLTE